MIGEFSNTIGIRGELDSLICDFKNKIFSHLLDRLIFFQHALRAINGKKPLLLSPPQVIWILQPSGYKKAVDNPEYHDEFKKNDLIFQAWWKEKKEAEIYTRKAFSDFLVMYGKVFYLENGAIPRFTSKKDLFQHLGYELLSPIIPDEYKDSGVYADVDPMEWLLEEFSDIDCSQLLYSPELAFNYHSDEVESTGHKFDEYFPQNERNKFEFKPEKWYEGDEDQCQYEDQYSDEYRKDLSEELNGYLDDYHRSEVEGWYYSDDDGRITEDY